MAENNKQINTTVLALLGGAVVGAGLALLFAPAPGTETRKKVGGWLSKNYQKGKEGAAHKAEQINAAYRAGKEAYMNEREKVAA